MVNSTMTPHSSHFRILLIFFSSFATAAAAAASARSSSSAPPPPPPTRLSSISQTVSFVFSTAREFKISLTKTFAVAQNSGSRPQSFWIGALLLLSYTCTLENTVVVVVDRVFDGNAILRRAFSHKFHLHTFLLFTLLSLLTLSRIAD